MASLSRALINATHSATTLQTEIEFALAIGPPLHLGVGLLAIVLFSLTYLDPVTKKSSVPAHILRSICGLGAIYGFYDFGFGHYVTHDDRISRQVRAVLLSRHYLLRRRLNVYDATDILRLGPDITLWNHARNRRVFCYNGRKRCPSTLEVIIHK